MQTEAKATKEVQVGYYILFIPAPIFLRRSSMF